MSKSLLDVVIQFVLVGLPLIAVQVAGARRLKRANGDVGEQPLASEVNHAEWAGLGDRLGLRAVGTTYMEGAVEGREVIVDPSASQDATGAWRTLTRLRVRLPASAASVSIAREGMVGSRDLETGDSLFDRKFNIGAAPKVSLAHFRHDVREQLTALSDQGLETAAGYFVLYASGDLKRAESSLKQLVSLANALDVTDEPARLASMVERDPVAGVRHRALQTLQQKFPRHDATRKAAAGGLTDPDPAVRRLAYILFIQLESPEMVQARLPAALADPDAGVRAIAMPLVPTTAGTGLFDAILSCVDLTDDTLDIAVAGTLSKLGNPRAEPALLRLLARDSTEVRRAAAEALGMLGTLVAVEPILPLTEGFTTPGALKEAARDAIRKIQSRGGSADAGRLSLVEAAETAGALSLATEGGELSIVPSKSRDRA